jgi:hypothetical protein
MRRKRPSTTSGAAGRKWQRTVETALRELGRAALIDCDLACALQEAPHREWPATLVQFCSAWTGVNLGGHD